jgi:hypothetical protein
MAAGHRGDGVVGFYAVAYPQGRYGPARAVGHADGRGGGEREVGGAGFELAGVLAAKAAALAVRSSRPRRAQPGLDDVSDLDDEAL